MNVKISSATHRHLSSIVVAIGLSPILTAIFVSIITISSGTELNNHQWSSGPAFENFGNLRQGERLDALIPNEQPMDHCFPPAGCDPSKWSLTVILPFFKRIGRFEDVVGALIASSARIDRIIFALNGSPLEREILAKINDFKVSDAVLLRNISVDSIVSSLEIGFYFRFMVAQLLDTAFVAFIDDDQIVSPDFLKTCLESMHVQKFFGVCGIRGGLYSVGSPNWFSEWSQHNGREGGEFREYGRLWLPGAPTDSLFSVFVMPASWVKLIFRERLWSFKTGEDLTIPYLIRKYAGLNSNIIPVGPEFQMEIYGINVNRSWNGNIDFAASIHDSFREGFVGPGLRADNYLRYEILEQHHQRGEFFKYAARIPSRQRTLIVIGSAAQAQFVVDFLPQVLEQQTGVSRSCELGLVWKSCSKNTLAHDFAIAIVADNSQDDGTATKEDAILSILGLDMRDQLNYHSTGIFRYLNGWDFVRAPAASFTFSDLMLNFGAVLRSEQPQEVVILADGGVEAAAAALVARVSDVPHISVVNVQNQDEAEKQSSISKFSLDFVLDMAGSASEPESSCEHSPVASSAKAEGAACFQHWPIHAIFASSRTLFFVGFLQEEVTALRAALAEAKHTMQLQSDVPLLHCLFDAPVLPPHPQ
jgi:hypothetical protein